MYFVLSKLLWMIAAPSNAIALTIAAGAVVERDPISSNWSCHLRDRRIRSAVLRTRSCRRLAAAPAGGSFRAAGKFDAPDGIIVLGGDISPAMFEQRGVLATTGARLTEAVALARRFPLAQIVFTGGSSNLFGKSIPEAEAAERFLAAMGVPSGRTTFEARSRNTSENAMLTRDLVSPKPGERWLLVTSAFHMPRAMGAFRHAGFDVIAWPADNLSLGVHD